MNYNFVDQFIDRTTLITRTIVDYNNFNEIVIVILFEDDNEKLQIRPNDGTDLMMQIFKTCEYLCDTYYICICVCIEIAICANNRVRYGTHDHLKLHCLKM